jgi:hypothetical protein
MNRTRACIAILAIPLGGLGLGFGCLGQVERTYFDDLVDGSVDGTTAPVEASAGTDASVSTDGQGTSDDALSVDSADALADAASDVRDAGYDVVEAAPVEAGCGPTTTLTNCGQCGAACDTTHSSDAGCAAGACQYACSPGFGDCQPAAPDLNGCETPLTTPTNCSGCGIACDTAHSTGAGCSGTTCTYSGCQSGWSDCNSAAPNAAGCECNSPACCDGGACQPQHSDGFGDTFYDCTPLGQYTSTLALEACTAYTGNAHECASFPCRNPGMGPIICSSQALSKDCLCWSFGGSNVGLVDNAGGPPGDAGTNCFCPSAAAGDTPWQ